MSADSDRTDRAQLQQRPWNQSEGRDAHAVRSATSPGVEASYQTFSAAHGAMHVINDDGGGGGNSSDLLIGPTPTAAKHGETGANGISRRRGGEGTDFVGNGGCAHDDNDDDDGNRNGIGAVHGGGGSSEASKTSLVQRLRTALQKLMTVQFFNVLLLGLGFMIVFAAFTFVMECLVCLRPARVRV